MKKVKRAIIVGASSGIGNALARHMSQQGYELGLVGRRGNLLEELKRALPLKAEALALDIVKTEEVHEKLPQLIEQLGGVEVIVICAGVGFMNRDLHWEREKLMFDVNILGFSAVCNVAFQYFKERGGGQIVALSSLLAVQGSGHSAGYSASKAFVSAYMQNLRRRVCQMNLPMTLTNIEAGFVDTPMTQGNRMMFWVASAEKAAAQIYSAIRWKKDHAYVPKRWGLIAGILRILPDFLFKKF